MNEEEIVTKLDKIKNITKDLLIYGKSIYIKLDSMQRMSTIHNSVINLIHETNHNVDLLRFSRISPQAMKRLMDDIESKTIVSLGSIKRIEDEVIKLMNNDNSAIILSTLDEVPNIKKKCVVYEQDIKTLTKMYKVENIENKVRKMKNEINEMELQW